MLCSFPQSLHYFSLFFLWLAAGKFVVFKVPSNPIRRAPAPPKKRRAAECDNRPTKVSCSRTKEPSSHNGKGNKPLFLYLGVLLAAALPFFAETSYHVFLYVDLESAGAADKGSFPPVDNTILSQLEAEINDDHHLNLELDDLDANYDYNPLSDESPGLSSGNPAGGIMPYHVSLYFHDGFVCSFMTSYSFGPSALIRTCWR